MLCCTSHTHRHVSEHFYQAMEAAALLATIRSCTSSCNIYTAGCALQHCNLHIKFLSRTSAQHLSKDPALCMKATLQSVMFRWTRGLLKLLQQPLPSDQMQLAAAAVHAMSSMPLFVQHVQADTSLYFMLTQAAAHALHSGTR